MQVIAEDPKCNQTKTSTLKRKTVSSDNVASDPALSEISGFSAFLQHKHQVRPGGQPPAPTAAAHLACEPALLKARPSNKEKWQCLQQG